MSVILETTLGDITVDLFVKERPRTCLNFMKLCKIKYYNFCLIHSIQRNFMVQTGDPLSTGRGGESIFCKLYGDQAKFFEAEVLPKMRHIEIGTVSMVNNGENMHGSQFFITTGENLDYLDGVHTVFGQVVEGLDVLMKINDAICDEQNCPYKEIRISHTVILDDPFDDPTNLEIPPASPEPTEEQLMTERIGVHEEMDDTTGKNLEEIEEEIKDKEAKARATILEMIGDLPESDVKPPENVLFVCKLNPVTTDDDLEVIFSRFGQIISCEVIRDRKTNESLQYAFIEFEKEEDCENAFFKMDNVLIDDRRIHVDFSQSVSKLSYYDRKKLAGKLSGGKPKQEMVLKGKGNDTQRGYKMVFHDEQEPPTRNNFRQESEKTREHSTKNLKTNDGRRHRSRSRSRSNSAGRRPRDSGRRRRSSSRDRYKRHHHHHHRGHHNQREKTTRDDRHHR